MFNILVIIIIVMMVVVVEDVTMLPPKPLHPTVLYPSQPLSFLTYTHSTKNLEHHTFQGVLVIYSCLAWEWEKSSQSAAS